MSMKICEYEVDSWQGFIQQIVQLVGHGYYYYHIGAIPDNKEDRTEKIDAKIIGKYRLENDTKNTRYRRKKEGLANFKYLRWENTFVILRTLGDVIRLDGSLLQDGKNKENSVISKEDVLRLRFNQKQVEKYQVSFDDPFTDIRQTPMRFLIGEEVSLNVQMLTRPGEKNPVTVKFTKTFMKDKKAELAELVEKRAKNRLLDVYNNLNGVTAWSGIVEQKAKLKRFVLSHAKKHGLKVHTKELRLNTFREPVKLVFVLCDDNQCFRCKKERKKQEIK